MSSKAVLAVLIVCVCAAVIAVHWPALSAQALSFDDNMYLVDNTLVKSPSWFSAWKFLSEGLEPSTVRGYYQPLAMISLMFDYSLGGRVENLMPFHRTSLVLHAANTALIIVLLYLLFGQVWIAAAVGLLFGLHPMTVETIPWVGERKTLLAAFFAFWSLLFYIRYAKARDAKTAWTVTPPEMGTEIGIPTPIGQSARPFYIACLASYFLALMSKPTSVPLPLMMLLLDFWPLKRIKWQKVFEKIPFFLLACVFAVITYISQTRTANSTLPSETGIWHISLVLCHNIIFYLYKIVWPVNLSSHYPFPDPMNLSQPMVLAGVIGTCILIPLLLASLRWTRSVFICWLCFFVVILPTMQIIGFSIVIASDKFAYLPSLGLLMLLAFFLSKIKSLSPRKLGYKIIIAILVLSVACAETIATRNYLVHWRNSVGLCEYMLSKAPNASQLHNSLGVAYGELGRYQEAIESYKQAIRIEPDYAEAHNNLGVAYGKVGNGQKEIECYKQAISINPAYTEAYFNLGAAYGKAGNYQEEMEYYKRALETKPDFGDANFNLGVCYGKVGRYDEAVECYKAAIKNKRDFADAHYNLGNALSNVGRYEEAIENYKQTIRIKPDFIAAYINLGYAYSKLGYGQKEIECYMQAIKIQPGNLEASFNLGIYYGKLGLYEDAIEYYKSAIKSRPDFAPAHKNLGVLLARMGRLDEAVKELKEALRIAPDYADAATNLAEVLARIEKAKQ